MPAPHQLRTLVAFLFHFIPSESTDHWIALITFAVGVFFSVTLPYVSPLRHTPKCTVLISQASLNSVKVTLKLVLTYVKWCGCLPLVVLAFSLTGARVIVKTAFETELTK